KQISHNGRFLGSVMKRLLQVGCVYGLFLSLGFLTGSAAFMPSALAATPLQQPEKVTLILKMAKGLTQAQAQAVVRGHGATPKASVAKLDLQIIEVPAQAADAIVQAMKGDAQIQRVEADQTRKWQSTPSDTLYPNQWSLPKIGWDQV